MTWQFFKASSPRDDLFEEQKNVRYGLEDVSQIPHKPANHHIYKQQKKTHSAFIKWILKIFIEDSDHHV